MTGQWEAFLKRIERGEASLSPFIAGIEEYVREVVGKVGALPAAPRAPSAHSPSAHSSEKAGVQPATLEPTVTASEGESLDALLHRAFGLPHFVPIRRKSAAR